MALEPYMFWQNISLNIKCLVYFFALLTYKTLPGDYCEEVIPDPIPNSEVKLFSADGTLP